MKKFVSMAMVAAMTTSMVPATAFAGAGEVSAKAYIVDAWTMTKDFDGEVSDEKLSAENKTVPELHIEITDVNYKNTKAEDAVAEITVALDNAELIHDFSIADHVRLILDKDATGSSTEVTAAADALYGASNGGTLQNPDPASAMGVLAAAEQAQTAAAADVTTKQTALDNAITAAKTAALAGTSEAAAVTTAQDAVGEADAAVAVKEAAVTTAETAKDTAAATYGNALSAEATAKTNKENAEATAAALATRLSGLQTAETEATTALAAGEQYFYDADNDGTAEEITNVANQITAVITTVTNDKNTADTDVTTKTTAYTNAQSATAAAKTAYDSAVTALETANTELTAAQTALNEAKADLEEAKTALENKEVPQATIDADPTVQQAKTDLTTAQTAKDNADTAVTNAQKAVDKAKAEYEAAAGTDAEGNDLITFEPVEGTAEVLSRGRAIQPSNGEDEFTFKVRGELHEGDVIAIDLETIMDKTSVGRQATLDVSSDDLNIDVTDLVYVGIEEYGITATTKEIGNIAEEEYRTLEKDLKIESTVGNFTAGQEFELKLSNGFEFKSLTPDGDDNWSVVGNIDKDEAKIRWNGGDVDEFTIDAEDMEIEATSAKSGKTAVLTIKAVKDSNNSKTFKATTKVEVMKVVDYTVIMSVDADEDVPVIYSGVNVKNYGITDDSDHLSLEVTVEETFPGAWSMRKGFNFELPDGVYVTNVDVLEAENFSKTDAQGNVIANVDEDYFEEEFGRAYQEADHKAFEFDKRVFDDVNNKLTDEVASVTFQMELVADPGFVGDVNLKFTGDLVDEQEVTIAKFATPYYVQAEQNDLKIDYRYTSVPTEVVITEAEPGLWDKDEAAFTLKMDHADTSFFEFEDADVTVDEESGMEIEADVNKGAIEVEMKDDSDDTAAVITVSNIEMFMSRSIPAGPYDLEAVTSLGLAYMDQMLFAPDDRNTTDSAVLTVEGMNNSKHVTDINGVALPDGWDHDCDDCDEEYFVGCVADFSTTVKEGFINVVTAGREQDDASFTTKVVVPVGEAYLVAGENQVELDVPAYVSEAGYTMLPVRAVAKALGINNNNVIWNGETKTVTILYGQRIITMVAGQKTVNVNGSVIPASAAVEIVEGRTFLPMRDLATALGVTDITWDAATKTATLNGGVVAE